MRRLTVRRSAIAVGAASLLLLTAGSVSAIGGFSTTSTASLAVAAGGSATAAEDVHLDPAPAAADVVLAFDATASMGGAIAQAKTDANAIVTGVTAGIPQARFAVVHFQDYPIAAYGYGTLSSDDKPYVRDLGLTNAAPSVHDAIGLLGLGFGGDAEESYNRVFYEAYSDTGLAYAADAQRVLVVLGDEVGHDPNGSTFNGNCPNTANPDAGVNGLIGGGDDLTTQQVLDGLKGAKVSLSFVSYAASGSAILACQRALAAFTGGSVVQGSTSTTPVEGDLAGQIVTLVKSAAAHISTLVATATNTTETGANPASWVSFTGLPASANIDQTAGTDFPFTATVNPPAGATPGEYHVNLNVVANGVTRATQPFTITVSAPLANLSATASPLSPGAGIDEVKLTDIPNGFLSFAAGSTSSAPVGSTPVGSTPVGSTPVGSTPVGSTPVGSTPVGSTPVGSTPVGSTPVGSTGLLDLPVGSTPVGSTALGALMLSQIPLCGDAPLPNTNQVQCQADGATWAAVLSGTAFQNLPLNSLTLADVVADTVLKGRLNALPLKDLSLATTLFKSVQWASLLLGPTPLLSLPVPPPYATWCAALADNGGSCLNINATTTVLQADVGGQIGSAPVGSTPVGSTPVGSTPVGSTPVGSTNIAVSRLAGILLSDINPIDGVVTCSVFGVAGCAGKTLGDAYTANGIVPTVTFGNAALKAAMTNAGITINDLLVAILGAGGLPWEQLPVRGLQPYSQTQSHVTYTLQVSVDCSVKASFDGAFKLTARLPAGFFPVDGTAKLSLNNAPATDAGAPTVLGETVAAAADLNAYRWTLSCGGINTAAAVAKLAFEAYVGLDLGPASLNVTAQAAGFTINASNQAPVNVVQNKEPANDDPNTAPTAAPNRLIVGHIAFSGDQDMYKVDLSALPRGTKVAAYLKVPHGADLDLTISKPSAPSLFSNPVGSTPVGSTPIEDMGIGFASGGRTVPSETLQDIPVGSTPVGSTPVGSTPVGSTSTTRGDVNEAAQIITTGESGFATIGISGYNGASSGTPYVLRIAQTPPPPLPTTCPAPAFANGSPSAFASGSLPASLPAATKTVFVVNKQRMYAMYGQAATDLMLTRLGSQGTAGSFAARSEVTGTVLQVDGNLAARTAYAAWDASPCDVTLANNVVRSIKDVVAGYRGGGGALPNLHYVVVLGSDEATPMARTPDPVTLSPEQNEAADLAFTTGGLVAGNALYASAAGNNILSDGAYGTFTGIPWLGRDLLLPQLSVSRLVETPDDIRAQVNRYLASSGLAGSPQTAPGTLAPASILPTGYDFLADGANAVRDNLKNNFSVTPAASVGANPAITDPAVLPALTPWSATDLRSSFFQSASPADIASLNAHYNHYELAAADKSLATTADALAPLMSRILFTMGCHGGLNVPDTLGPAGPPGAKYLDWPQLYATKLAAMYIANTGYGYGDSESVALSERLMSLFAKNLHSDASSVGEQWAATLQQYFATAGAYDVYDAKVLEEATFYGLPFWHFSTAGTAPAYTPLATAPDAVVGTQSANVVLGSGLADPTQFGLYRPLVSIASREVTSATGPARGIWITDLQTSDAASTAKLGRPTIDLTAHEPAPNVRPIFFPASPFTLEHSVLFGRQRDYVNVSNQFRPAPTPTNPNAGTTRKIVAASVEVLYSNAVDDIPPLISQVNVTYAGGNAKLEAHVTDDSGTVAQVAALVNDGSWHYVRLDQDPADPTVFSKTVATAVGPEVFVEATDGVNVSFSANKGSNFTSTTSAAPAGPTILIQAPVGPYSAGAIVNATYTCSVPSCIGAVPSGGAIDTTPGLHAFKVTATDGAGNSTTVQRLYAVGDLVLTASVSPSTASAGTSVTAKASLSNTASVARDVTLSATFAFRTAYVVNSSPVTFRLAAGKTIAVSVPFVMAKKTPSGTYSVTLRASDAAGTVSANATLTVP